MTDTKAREALEETARSAASYVIDSLRDFGLHSEKIAFLIETMTPVLAALSRVDEGWQPMECCTEDDSQQILVAHESDGRVYSCTAGFARLANYVTHYQPLPAPPQHKEGE